MKRQNGIYMRELTCVIMGLVNPKSAGWASRLEVQVGDNITIQALSYLCCRVLSRPGEVSLCSIQPSSNWVRLLHMTEGSLFLFSESTDLNVNITQKHTIVKIPRKMYVQISGGHFPVKWLENVRPHTVKWLPLLHKSPFYYSNQEDLAKLTHSSHRNNNKVLLEVFVSAFWP